MSICFCKINHKHTNFLIFNKNVENEYEKLNLNSSYIV